MKNIIKLIVDDSEKEIRIDLFLSNKKKELSRTRVKNAELETKKTDKELLRRLHVEQDGKIYVGIDAFLLIWKSIPKYKFLYKFFKLPVIYQLFYVGYEIVAFFLYLKNKHQLN